MWEDERFIGAIIFSTGGGQATNGARYGLARHFDVIELARVALGSHKAPTSRIVAIAVRLFRARFPRVRMLISYADPRQGHHGGIYQAMGWIYSGPSGQAPLYVDRAGREYHSRVVSTSGRKRQFGRLKPCIDPATIVRKIQPPAKHRYLLPLDDEIRARVLPFARTYPKRGDHAALRRPVEADGSNPISPLQP